MEKILVIKLGAKGDVVRTLPVLLGIKEKFPNSNITWITKEESREILETSPLINQVLALPISGKLDKFDILYNFDTEESATKLASEIHAHKKYGFYLDSGYPAAFNFPAEYYLNTVFDDELKKSNKKTYQEMMFEVAELPYKKQHHSIYLSEFHKKYAEDFIKKNKIDKSKLLGIHIGASSRWPSKTWHEKKILEFIKKAKSRGFEIILFAGPNEKSRQEKLMEELKKQEIEVFKNNPDNADLEFAALVNVCKIIVCGDSLALHISLALKKPTIALFFCTSPDEVEGYGILKKIISPILYDFFPEKSDQYNEELTKSISADEVMEAVEKINKNH